MHLCIQNFDFDMQLYAHMHSKIHNIKRKNSIHLTFNLLKYYQGKWGGVGWGGAGVGVLGGGLGGVGQGGGLGGESC